jgi:hypothetical protein
MVALPGRGVAAISVITVANSAVAPLNQLYWMH